MLRGVILDRRSKKSGPGAGRGWSRSALACMHLICVLLASGFEVSCTSEPVYLGVSDDVSSLAEEPSPFCAGADRCFLDDGLSDEDVDAFRSFYEQANLEVAPSHEPAPTWVYPLSFSVHPNNLGLISLHFLRAQEEQHAFEVSVQGQEKSFRMFVPCLSAGGNGCVYRAPEGFWIELATEFAGQTVEIHLRALGLRGVSSASQVTITFSPQPVEGGLYYWSAELRGIYRLPFGGRQAVPFVAPGTEENPDECAGCHSVSRDGGTIALIFGSADPEASFFENAAFSGGLRVARVTSPQDPIFLPAVDEPGEGGMVALSSDGSRVASAYDFKIALRNTDTGELLSEESRLLGKMPFFPEFSPDNTQLVLTLSDLADTEIAVRNGSIAIVSVEGDRFGAVTELVPAEAGTIFYYPTWSPDGKWVAYVSGPASVGDEGKSYDQDHAELKLVSVQTGATFDLRRASGPLASTSTWPKFAPFSQCASGVDLCSEEERVFFLSYSSKRPYGLLANQPGDEPTSQLWMSAISVSQAREGEDPSSAPIWVPYQSPTSRNHLGFWTEALRCNAAYPCGPGFKCNAGGACEAVVR